MIKLWPWILTFAAIIAAAFIFCLTPDMITRSQLGDYLSGFASAIAFIWLIAAYLQQGAELRLQREELSMQRTSLDLQREELRKLGKYAALEQVAHVLDQFDIGLQKNPDAIARSANDLPIAFTNGMKDWKVLLEGKDPNSIFEAYMRWMKINGPCLEFLERVVSAIDIYCEATDQSLLSPIGSSAERIYFDFEKIKNIPYVRHYIGAAYGLATSVVLTAPGLDRIQLAGMEAIDKIMPGTVKDDAIVNLRAKVAAHKAAREKANMTKQT
jgi:hypothetical protein